MSGFFFLLMVLSLFGCYVAPAQAKRGDDSRDSSS